MLFLTRTHDWSGIQQALTVQPGHRYVFKGYIKLLNSNAGQQTHRIKLMLQTTDSHGTIIFRIELNREKNNFVL